MSAFQNPNATFITTTNVGPSLFVKQSGPFEVAQSGAGDASIGISQNWAEYFNSSYAAASGDPVGVYGLGQECWLIYGGSVTAGDRLKPDSSGRGVTASGTEGSAAVALETGTVGKQYRVRVELFIPPGTGATGATGPQGATGPTGP